MNNKVNINKNYMLTPDNAPKSYAVYLNCDHRLLIETYERIKNKQDIFWNMYEMEIEKIKRMIIPALLNDKLIEEKDGGFNSLKEGIIFDSRKDMLLTVKSHHTFSRDICAKVTEETKFDFDIFEYVSKKVSKKDFNRITAQLKDLKQAVINLQESADDDIYNCDFAVMFHKEIFKKENRDDKSNS